MVANGEILWTSLRTFFRPQRRWLVCVTGISIVRVMAVHGARASAAADGLAVAAILSYTALRSPAAGKWLERYADLIFVFGLMLMVVLGFVLAWVGRRWRGLRITRPTADVESGHRNGSKPGSGVARAG